jgi:hypothetical protein
MSITPKEVQAIMKMADIMYDFLPANPNPYADQSISFPGCARKIGVIALWAGGSKRPAVNTLLRNVLEQQRGLFCKLVLEIVNTAFVYRNNKKNPIKREEIVSLNSAIQEVGFKIPELWDATLLNSLPTDQKITEKQSQQPNSDKLAALRQEYIDLTNITPIQRGFAFQKFLNSLFALYNLNPHSAFRLTGEEIDGSFEIDSNVYLLEAKWQATPSGQKDLSVFSMKVSGKSTWSRGLFVSYMGFTPDGLEAFARGKQTNLIGMDGQDLFFIVDGKITLDEAIRRKARRAAETNDFYTSVYSII